MHVVGLTFPGTWLKHVPQCNTLEQASEQPQPEPADSDGGTDRDWVREMELLLIMLESKLMDVVLTLNLFLDSEAQANQRQQGLVADREKDWAENAEVSRKLISHPDFDPERFAEDIQKAQFDLRMSKWAAGKPPMSYEHRIPFMYAREFIYSLDTIGSC
jgi:hypothetical protein